MLAFLNPGRPILKIALGVGALCLAGIVLEQIGERQDRRRYQQIGKSVDIGGRTLNIYCSGEGGPSVVFETFGHMSGYTWSGVQRELAKFTRACWYDRAAYGWSDPAPMPRTFQSVASDLRALLHAAGIPAPYVLVGAGDAALHIRVFQGMYPSEVAGVVMVNANDVDDPEIEIPEAEKGPWAKHFGSFAPRVRAAACVMYPIMAETGLVRLASLFQKARRTPGFGLTSEQRAELDFLSDNPTAQRGSELCARQESMQQVRAAGNLGSVGLIVLASDGRPPEATSAQTAVAAAWNTHNVEQTQPELVRLSSHGRLILLDGDVETGAIVRASLDVAGALNALEKQ